MRGRRRRGSTGCSPPEITRHHPDRHREGLLTAAPARRAGPAAPGVAADLARRAATPDLGHGVGRLAAGLPPGSGPAARRSPSCPATTPPATAPCWPAGARLRRRRCLAATATRARLDRRLVGFPATSSTGSSRPRRDADRDAAPRGARCARRGGGGRGAVPPVGARGRLRRRAAAVGARRRARRPDVAPYQVMKLRLLNGSHSVLAYLGRGRGLHDRRRRAGDPVGRAAGARVRRRGRPDPAAAGLDAAARTSTTWSPGSATPPCITGCARSAPTVR